MIAANQNTATAWAFGRLGRYLARIAERRPPDVIIGGAADPYMRRWWVIPRNRFFNVYLHHFMRSDDDRALHDHPWWNVSFLLQGQYAEHTISAGGINVFTTRKSGEVDLAKVLRDAYGQGCRHAVGVAPESATAYREKRDAWIRQYMARLAPADALDIAGAA